MKSNQAVELTENEKFALANYAGNSSELAKKMGTTAGRALRILQNAEAKTRQENIGARVAVSGLQHAVVGDVENYLRNHHFTITGVRFFKNARIQDSVTTFDLVSTKPFSRTAAHMGLTASFEALGFKGCLVACDQ